jgi:hypothetical protein
MIFGLLFKGRVARVARWLWGMGYPVAAGAAPFVVFAIPAFVATVVIYFVLLAGMFGFYGPVPSPELIEEPPFPALWIPIMAVAYFVILAILLVAVLAVAGVLIAAFFLPFGWVLAGRRAAGAWSIFRFALMCVVGEVVVLAALSGVGVLLLPEWPWWGALGGGVVGLLLGVPYFVVLWCGGALESGLRLVIRAIIRAVDPPVEAPSAA